MLCLSCAGELENPERFGFLLNAGRNSVPAGGSGGTGVVLPGGGTGGAAGALASRTAPDCVKQAFAMSCNSPACHERSMPQVDLVSPGFEERVIGKVASSMLSCSGRVLVSEDGSPSLLLDKLSDTPPCGVKMPLGRTLMPADAKACITAWVMSVSQK
jgi:hypothetical protein